MIVAGSASPLLLSSAGGYNLTNSLRFRSSASAYLNRTFGTPTSQNTWTLSFWTKRGTLGTQVEVFSAGTSNRLEFLFASNNTFQIADASTNFIITNAVFRDPSAWYHIVVRANGSGSAMQVYVNGVVTSNSTTNNLTTSYWNASGTVGYIGSLGGFSSNYYDGYMAEVNFVDGQALTPSSFGQTSATTGVWIPKKYTGNYGTNGFYLPFTDNSALTTSSNAGLGKDFSGNANYWTTNNISITAGTTYDSMTDVPTLTSATAANYCVLNPLNNGGLGTASITDGNLKITYSSADSLALGTIGLVSGKWYWEITGISVTSGTNFTIGVSPSPYTSANSRLYASNGQYYNGSAWASYGATYTNNDVIGIALDLNSQTIEFFKNGTSQGQKTSIGLSGITEFPQIYINNSGNSAAANFGQQPFAYTPPTGFVRLNTFNLPTPTIGATASTTANKYFDVTLYTGTGATQTITNSGSMQPDWVWIKSRSLAYAHNLGDSVRGVNNTLSSNSTGAENYAGSGDITAFNTNGFSIRQTSNWELSSNGATYIAWQWRASNATAVTNTNGSITSTVSANTSAGFSIVTYTGNSTSGATVGHGLGVAPSMIILKIRSTTGNWPVYHVSTGNTKALYLDLTNGQGGDFTGAWNNTTPTSTVFTLGNSTETNANTGTFVAYCFAQVAGYSAFGSYTGNASTDGPFVFTGFRPRFILIKNSNVAGNNWWLLDTARSTYNVQDALLAANTAGTENNTTAVSIDFLSNGFKPRTSDGGMNGSGNTMIYMAFAENPFKYANAR